MKFQLLINPLNQQVQIVSEGQSATSDFGMIAERDPAEEMVFEEGCAFYNPLLKKQDAIQLFLINGDLALMGYNSGKAPAPSSKAERAAVARGWFKIEPRNLSSFDVPAEVSRQLQYFPKMMGVISQALRSRMGLRVPEDLDCKNFDDWMAWITAQRMAVTPTIRSCFDQLKFSPGSLIFPVATRTFLATGVEPEPLVDVRVRYCEVRTITRMVRQLFESYEIHLSVPKSVVAAGGEAILAKVAEKEGEYWKTIQEYPTGEDVSSDQQNTAESGTVIFVRPVGDQQYQLLSPPTNLPNSIHDIFEKVIEEYARKQT